MHELENVIETLFKNIFVGKSEINNLRRGKFINAEQNKHNKISKFQFMEIYKELHTYFCRLFFIWVKLWYLYTANLSYY